MARDMTNPDTQGKDMDTPDQERCDRCGAPPKGVTMSSKMDGWSCPRCGNYNPLE